LPSSMFLSKTAMPDFVVLIRHYSNSANQIV